MFLVLTKLTKPFSKSEAYGFIITYYYITLIVVAFMIICLGSTLSVIMILQKYLSDPDKIFDFIKLIAGALPAVSDFVE